MSNYIDNKSEDIVVNSSIFKDDIQTVVNYISINCDYRYINLLLCN